MHIFTIFEPITLPTDKEDPPENAAIKATVSSGSEVEKAIKLKPIDVLLNLVIVDTFTAFFIDRLLAQFRIKKETMITIISMIDWESTSSANFLHLTSSAGKHAYFAIKTQIISLIVLFFR